MDYKRVILNRLLDKYERSKSYLVQGQGSSRRVLLRLMSNEFPEYDVEQSETKNTINYVVQELAVKKLVGFAWYKHEKGNIIEKAWLIIESIDQACQEVGRIPKSDRAAAINAMVREVGASVSAAWIRAYLSEAEIHITAHKSTLPFLPDDEKGAGDILRALKAINDMNNTEDLERVFSLKCFGDSKHFERHVRKKVVGIVRKYLLSDANNGGAPLSDDEVLSQIGIVKAPEQVDFCGGLVAELAGVRIDFSAFKHGIAINSDTVKEIKVLECKTVQKVLFIENKANYLDYISKKKTAGELVIFHGGFYSPVKGLFFKKVYDAGCQAGISFYHWGDIDVGGFRIFNRLKANIIPSLKPLLMDQAAFLSKEQYWIKFDKKYGSILEEMLGRPEYLEFNDVIAKMLEVGAKLEQEAFL